MPRDEMTIDVALERLVVLDEQDEVDQELLPDLDDEFLRRLYRTMLLSRRFDERRLKLQRQGRIGTFAPAIGQEAAQLGAISAIDDDDWFVPSYRDTTAAIWRGTPLWGLLLYDAGHNEGAEPPEGQKDLPIAVPVGSQIPHATGLGFAARYRDTGEVVLTMFGDGATSEGDFHEAVNFASVHETPVVFFCQNNQYAISTPVELQTGSHTIVQKAVAYGVPGIQVDGNDVLGVHVAAREAVERARAGQGPTLIEAVTYRQSVHTTADDPSTYRDEEEEQEWMERDPIDRLARFLRDREILDDDRRQQLEDEVGEEVQAAWQEGEQRMQELTDPLEIFEHVYAERPAYLEEQREAFRRDHEAAQQNSTGKGDDG